MKDIYMVRLNLINKIALFLILAFAFTACMGVKPQGTRATSRHFESFYLGEGISQYFIKPMKFTQDKNTLLVDFTIRQDNYLSEGGTMNFSLKTPELFDKVDSLFISTSTAKIYAENLERLFLQKDSKNYHIRTSSSVSKDFITAFFDSEDLLIKVYCSNQSFEFEPNKKNTRNRKGLYDNLIVLIGL
jgi:hypothetical protein